MHEHTKWILKGIDGRTKEIDPSLKKVLYMADWWHMKVELNNNCTTRVLLGSRKGQFASMLLDWDCKLLHYQFHSINIKDYPCVKDKYSVAYYHNNSMIKVLERKGWPHIVLNPQFVSGPDGLYFLGYGSTEEQRESEEDPPKNFEEYEKEGAKMTATVQFKPDEPNVIILHFDDYWRKAKNHDWT